MSTPQSKQKVLIVGCGIFGVSTAIAFLENGGYEVRIVDKGRSVELSPPFLPSVPYLIMLP